MTDSQRTISHTDRLRGQNLHQGSITAREDDNDAGGLTFDVNSVSVNENGTGTYQVKLTHKPHGNVYVRVSAASGSGADYDITVRDTNDSANGNQTGSIPFTPDNYDTYRTVTLAARNDADSDQRLPHHQPHRQRRRVQQRHRHGDRQRGGRRPRLRPSRPPA